MAGHFVTRWWSDLDDLELTGSTDTKAHKSNTVIRMTSV